MILTEAAFQKISLGRQTLTNTTELYLLRRFRLDTNVHHALYTAYTPKKPGKNQNQNLHP